MGSTPAVSMYECVLLVAECSHDLSLNHTTETSVYTSSDRTSEAGLNSTLMRNVIEGSNGHQKDWLDLDNLRVKGLLKARLHTALSMLSEAMFAYTRVQNGILKGLTSTAYLK